MTFGSLFSGVGGLDLGLERSDMRCIWQVESDPACNCVLQRHWPGVPRHGDVRTIDPSTLPVPDLLCGGWPCQDLSVAGKRAGLAGERSGLFREFHRIAAALRPRWLVAENVPGLLSSARGRDFAQVLDSLVGIGYGLGWRVVDAQYFGVAQRRRRVFIVGCLGDPVRAAKVLFEPESLPGDSPPRREAGESVAPSVTPGARRASGNRAGEQLIAFGISSDAVDRSGEGDGSAAERAGLGIVEDRSPALRARSNNSVAYIPDSEVARCLATGANHQRYDGDTENFVVVGQNGSDIQVGSQCGTLKAGMAKQTSGPLVAHETGNGWWTEGLPGLRAQPGGMPENLVVHTLQAEGHDASEDSTGRGVPLVVRPMVRRLTPLECERLQGFPDGWTDVGLSDSARYRCLGNAVAVPVARWIGERIRMVEESS